jgi:Leucine-rich repeat (LRR) protein
LTNGAKGGAGGMNEQKQEDAKVGEQKKFLVNKTTTSLFLQQNQFRTVIGLSTILKDVMWNANRLLWIDLSYNYLEKIEDELVTNFPCLRTLYLHGCYILNLEEVRKLNTLPDLHTITLYGNPIEQIKGYRMWVLGVMYLQSESLKKLDQVVVTKKEFDAVCVWNEALSKNAAQKLKKLTPMNPLNIKKVPALKTDDDEKGKSNTTVA